jgi:serine/threonine-protein kinase
MAEVFRGRAISIEGFEKQIAIKRVLPHLAKNEKFVNMFLDEAKLSLFLDHANVVSVFDLGRSSDTYFIVMEYIDGANLKKVMEWCSTHRQRLPVELAAYITAEICKGLDYAHNKLDPSGGKLNIVHRDVSPPNVLISRQGEVKVTDFGLAKAQSQIEVTDPGVVKGKFGYLSPEAALGEVIDHRTDLFAVGIVLWEMLAGRRLFQGETDLETLGLVRAADIPPLRKYNPSVPPALEQIVRRGLARNPNERIQSARELGTLVSKFLVSQGLSVTSYDLSSYVGRVLADEAPSSRGGRWDEMSAVIQDEINKLVRIETKEPSQSVEAVEPGSLEDPRTWGDFAFDEPTGNAPRRSATGPSVYASRGASGGGGPSAATAVRPSVSGMHVGVSDSRRITPPRPSAPITPPPVRNTPPGPRPAVGSGPRARERASMQHSAPQSSVSDERAKKVFFALFGVAGLLAAWVVYLLLTTR